ncbi:MAG TPA: exodeoxyribonuclease VII small subunit [Ornithinicoccus sp.]|nr:exodeoxyribonuclease VII small subunit [Ornithinicoccus sp.]
MSTDPEASTADAPAVEELSYEDARDELVRIVARIEGGGASLEESMTLWERGEALAAHCEAKLNQAQEQLDRTPGGADGAAGGTKATADDSGEVADDPDDD